MVGINKCVESVNFTCSKKYIENLTANSAVGNKSIKLCNVFKFKLKTKRTEMNVSMNLHHGWPWWKRLIIIERCLILWMQERKREDNLKWVFSIRVLLGIFSSFIDSHFLKPITTERFYSFISCREIVSKTWNKAALHHYAQMFCTRMLTDQINVYTLILSFLQKWYLFKLFLNLCTLLA